MSPTIFNAFLFIIDADAALKGIKAFADVTAQSYFPDEDEVLLQMGTLFQLQSVKHRINDNLWIIRLMMIGDDQYDSQTLLNQMKNYDGASKTTLLHFGDLIRQMGKEDEAEKYYRYFLHQNCDDRIQVADCYHSLGILAEKKKKLDQSLQYHLAALAMKLARLEPHDPKLTRSYRSLGRAYRQQGNFSQALENYDKALKIWIDAFGENHAEVVGCVTNIGSAYEHQEKYDRALEYYQRALKIGETLLPINYRSLNFTLNNIGNIYKSRKEYGKALAYYERSLDLKLKIYPSNHPTIINTRVNIEKMYSETGSEEQCAIYFERVANIARQNDAS